MKKLITLLAMVLMLTSVDANADWYGDSDVRVRVKLESEVETTTGLKAKSQMISMSGKGFVYFELYGSDAPYMEVYLYGDYTTPDTIEPAGFLIECSNWDPYWWGIYATVYSYNPTKISTETFHAILQCEAYRYYMPEGVWSILGDATIDVKGTYNEKKDSIRATGKMVGGSFRNEIYSGSVSLQLYSW